MFRIIRTLNNNVALVKNEQGEQAVIMGLGLTMGKKKGDLVNPAAIEKQFILQTEESKENFMTLYQDVPLDFITTSYEMIGSLVKRYSYPIQDYIYITLTYHIFYAYKSLKKGDYQSGKLPDLAQDFPLEYQMAQEAVTDLSQHLKINFPKEEVERIAFHFINAKGSGLDLGQEASNPGKEILKQVEEVLRKQGISKMSSKQDAYERFMVHLTYLIGRREQVVNDNEKVMESLADSLIHSYPQAYALAEEIYEILLEQLAVSLPKSEMVYLTLHIQRIL